MREYLIGFVLKTFRSLEPEDVDHIRGMITALRQRDFVKVRELLFAFINQSHFAVDHIDL